MRLLQSHAAQDLHRYTVHRPGRSSGRLAAVFDLRLNVPNVSALIPQFTILHSNKERALYDSRFFSERQVEKKALLVKQENLAQT